MKKITLEEIKELLESIIQRYSNEFKELGYDTIDLMSKFYISYGKSDSSINGYGFYPHDLPDYIFSEFEDIKKNYFLIQ
jgi:hypothetical protein